MASKVHISHIIMKVNYKRKQVPDAGKVTHEFQLIAR
jgi:hypothetical protein